MEKFPMHRAPLLLNVYDLKGTVNCVTGFHEERAILLGRLGRHEQALTIYIHILKDNHLAEQ